MGLIYKAASLIGEKFGIAKGRIRRKPWEKNGHIIRNRFGVRFYLPNCYEDLIQTSIMESEFFDFEVLKNLRKYIKENSVILDIGANIGNHTMFFMHFCHPEKIYAFEPVPATYSILAKNMVLNNHDGIVTAYPYAVGKSKGHASIASYNKKNIGGTELQEDAEGSMEIVSLDDFLPELNRLDFMKIDVEGFEGRVLEGAIKTIHRFKPIIYIEIFEENFDHVDLWLRDQGYEVVQRYHTMDYIYMSKR